MDNKEFLSKEQCEALSELNYDGDYDFVYHATGELWERGKKDKKERFLPAPLKQQVLRWFREKYKLSVYVTDRLHCVHEREEWKCVIDDFFYPLLSFETYEEAEDGAINKLIELAKQDNEQN
jgi:hypothetical protein